MVPCLGLRLSVQMFLQFAIWGSWAPMLAVHLADLGFTTGERANILSTAPLATIIAPLFAGQLADRRFATERFLGASYLVSAALFWVAGTVRDPALFLWVALAACLAFFPTLGLANALSFRHMTDPRRQFPVVRVFGTIGWIAAALALTFWMKAYDRPAGDCLRLAAVFAFLNGLYSFTLPHTPPRREGVERFAFLRALGMLRDPSFAIFLTLAFLLLALATFYYFQASVFFRAVGIADSDIPWVMGIGQVMEIASMFLLSVAYRRLGVRTTMAIGIAAWTLRFIIFSIGAPVALVVGAQALHGLCFAFAIAAAMIYVERICPPDARGSAQSLLTLATYGLGMLAGGQLGGLVERRFTTAAAEGAARATVQWSGFWLVPAVGCGVILVVFLLAFRSREPSGDPARAAARPA